MKKISLGDRLRYRFDGIMSKGPAALIGWLFLLTVVVILVVSVFMLIAGLQAEGDDYGIVVWKNLMRSMDAGTVAGDAGSWPFLFTMLFVTICGIFIFSTLIGILSNGIASKFESLRKGRSFVVEKEHTVILGWSEQVFAIVGELCAANSNRRRACIAILADRDKVEMEDEIRERVGRTGGTTIVCRSGSPIDPGAIEVVNPREARSIIILAPDSADPDSEVIKTLLALTNNPDRKQGKYHIVAEIHKPRNYEVAKLVAKDEVELVLTGDLTARIAAQTCRQSGLSIIYTELFDFGGDEIYFADIPALAGSSYGEALPRFGESALIGIHTAAGKLLLNPPMDTLIAAGDRVIAISEDDNTVALSEKSPPPVDERLISTRARAPKKPESTLILGWNWKGKKLVRELDSYSGPGSRLVAVADSEKLGEDAGALEADCEHLAFEWKTGDTTDRRLLDELDAPSYDHIIVLAYSDEMEDQAADSRTLITLLHLRRLSESSGKDFAIVSEMLDSRNRDLAEVAQADDFVIGDKLVALVLTQISENKDLGALFADLLDPEGSELYLKPAAEYIEPGSSCDFYALLEAARRKGETAIGYRLVAKAHDASASYGVVLNPRKSERIALGAEDKVIVLAED